MTTSHTPSATPNVVIENPKTRKAIRTVVDVIGAVAFVAVAVDVVSPEIDLVAWTTPITAGYLAVRSVFGFVVDNSNTPAR